MTKPERVQKLIAQASEYSRREAEELISQGKVAVNGVKITLGDQATTQDRITIDGKQLRQPQFVYYMLNKPKNYVTANKDEYTNKVVTALVPKNPRVYACGRLDKDATGLLILTNDGDFANSITHPRYEIIKTYIAVLKSQITSAELRKMQKGVEIDGSTIKPTTYQLDKLTVAVQVHVGKHKIVKRLFKAIGHYVKTLHRTHIGNLAVDIPEGKWRTLTAEDKKLLFAKPTITKETFLE